jgi:ABC-2 type transport system ATP-binding protein
MEKLLAVEGVKNAVLYGNNWEIESAGIQDIRPAVFEFAVKNQLVLLTLNEKQQNLEGVFHELTQI